MYTTKDFKKCVFNPMAEKKMLTEFPKLSEIVSPDWDEEPQLDSLLRYTIMVYDPASPLVINERDLNFRKSSAAELAKFDMDDEQLLTSIYSCTHHFVPELVVKYLARFGKSMEFALLVTLEYCYWESIRHLNDPINGDTTKAILEAAQKKGVLKDEAEKDIIRIDKYRKSFFGGDTEIEETFKRKSFSSPEKMLKNV